MDDNIGILYMFVIFSFMILLLPVIIDDEFKETVFGHKITKRINNFWKIFWK